MSYKVTLSRSFPGTQRRRADIVVTRTEPYEGELTDEQLNAVKADTELVVTGVERQVQDKVATSRTVTEKAKSKKA